MSEQPPKKRQKSGDSTETKAAATSTTTDERIEVAAEAEEEEETHGDQLEQDIEQEEKKADNLVIRDLMGSVKPESQKVNRRDRMIEQTLALTCRK